MFENFRKIVERSLAAYCLNNETSVALQSIAIRTSETEWSRDTDPLYAPSNVSQLEPIEMVDYAESDNTIMVTFEGGGTGGTYRMTYVIENVSVMQIVISQSISMKQDYDQLSRELNRRDIEQYRAEQEGKRTT